MVGLVGDRRKVTESPAPSYMIWREIPSWFSVPDNNMSDTLQKSVHLKERGLDHKALANILLTIV